MGTLDEHTVKDALADLAGWELEGDHIQREWRFDRFRQAIDFIVRVADLADQANHHPDLYNSYTKVRIRLTTHSEGGVTDKDLGLAREIDAIRLD